MTKIKNDLFDYKDMYIYQNVENFKFSLDSILLSEFVSLNKSTKKILDLCTGNAPIPLVLSTKTEEPIVGVEIQKEIYDLAIESIELNKKQDQISIINDDFNNLDKYFKYDTFDIITCNPPYFKLEKEGQINSNEVLSIARHEIKMKLEDIFNVSSKFLKDNGALYLVHRASRIDEIIILGNKYNMNVKKIQFIATNESNVPYLVLIKCVKKSKFGVIVNPVLNINGLTTYQNIFGGN